MEEQKTHETEIKLLDLWAILKSCWWQLLIVLIVVSMVLYIGLNATHEDEYTASVTIYVLALPTSGDNNTNFNNTAALSWATNLIHDCIILIKSHDQVLSPVVLEENLPIAAKDLEKMLTIKRVSEDARVLRLSFTSKNPERSAQIVNAIGERACEYFNDELYGQEGMLSVVDKAAVPETPSNPVSTVMILLVAFVCAAFVYAIHLLRFILDDKINNAEDVEKYLGLSMLGVIPNKNDVGRRRSKYGYYYSNTADGERKKQ